MRVRRHSRGCVRYDKRRCTWGFLWYDGAGVRRSRLIGSKADFPTKASAWREVERLELGKSVTVNSGETLRAVVARYQDERMPKRSSTKRVYLSFLKNHVLPQWGDTSVRDIAPRPLELWLKSLIFLQRARLTFTHLCMGCLSTPCFPACWKSGAILFPS